MEKLYTRLKDCDSWLGNCEPVEYISEREESFTCEEFKIWLTSSEGRSEKIDCNRWFPKTVEWYGGTASNPYKICFKEFVGGAINVCPGCTATECK